MADLPALRVCGSEGGGRRGAARGAAHAGSRCRRRLRPWAATLCPRPHAPASPTPHTPTHPHTPPRLLRPTPPHAAIKQPHHAAARSPHSTGALASGALSGGASAQARHGRGRRGPPRGLSGRLRMTGRRYSASARRPPAAPASVWRYVRAVGSGQSHVGQRATLSAPRRSSRQARQRGRGEEGGIAV